MRTSRAQTKGYECDRAEDRRGAKRQCRGVPQESKCSTAVIQARMLQRQGGQ